MLDTNRSSLRRDRNGNRPIFYGRSTFECEPSPRASATFETPMIEVSESEGTYRVFADFRMIPEAKHVTVEFARQGIVITGGTIERYVPIPTDGDIELTRVEVGEGVARIAVPTAGHGQRWRAIVMW